LDALPFALAAAAVSVALRWTPLLLFRTVRMCSALRHLTHLLVPNTL